MYSIQCKRKAAPDNGCQRIAPQRRKSKCHTTSSVPTSQELKPRNACVLVRFRHKFYLVHTRKLPHLLVLARGTLKDWRLQLHPAYLLLKRRSGRIVKFLPQFFKGRRRDGAWNSEFGGEITAPIKSSIQENAECRRRKVEHRTARVRKRKESEKTVSDEERSTEESNMESPQGTLRRELRRDDFWEAISPDYNYLMDCELIQSCREARGELALDEAGVSPLCDTLSFAKFVRQFNHLHDWLHELHSSILDSMPEQRPDAIVRVQQELHQHEASVKLFAEEAQNLCAVGPNMKEDVNRRMNLLSNKWEAVSRAVEPSKEDTMEPSGFQEVAQEMRRLRGWLRELEGRLPSQLVGSSCSFQQLQEHLSEQQAVQQEIESRGRFVKSLLRQCESLSCTSAGAGEATDSSLQGAGEASSLRKSSSSLPLPSWKAQRFCRVAANLEKRWHGLWLKSLEWQCRLEQLINKYGNQWDSGSDRGHGDEPLSKQPRLSNEWDEDLSAMEVTVPLPGANVAQDPVRQSDSPTPQWDIPPPVQPAAPTYLEKGVMVGTTGIAELKAKTGSGRFEIIQDVGYSSESSTQLSSEDCIHIYSYGPEETSKSYWENDAGDVERPGLEGRWNSAPEEDYEDYKTCPLIQNTGPAADLYRMTSLEPEGGFSDLNSEAVNAILGDDDEWKDGLADGLSSEKQDTSNSSCPLDVSFMTEVAAVRRVKRTLETTKVTKVQEWLERCNSSAGGEEDEDSAPCHVDSSCDASGEYTTNEEDNDSDAADTSSSGSQGRTTSRSVSLSKSGTGSVETVVQVGAGGDARYGGVVMRTGLRSKKRGRDRPWSVTDVKGAGALSALSPFSTSETALNVLMSAASGQQGLGSEGRPRTCSVGVQKDLSDLSSPEHRLHRQRRARAFRSRTFRSDSSSEAVSGSSSARLRRVRDVSAASLSGSAGHLSGHHTSSSGTENYHDCMGISQASLNGFPVCDATLTHVEEQSSVSDQMWDDYQDPPYCSEPYSEQTADEDQVKKLLHFGDDYRAFIGSHSDTSSLSGLHEGPRRPPHKLPRSTSKTQVNAATDFDSDSDVEDFQHLLGQSVRAYQFIQNTLQKHLNREPKEIATSKFAELVATCQTNLHCLQVIKVHLHTGAHSPQLEKLISQWEALLTELQRRQSTTQKSTESSGNQPQQQEADVLSDIAALRAELDALARLVRKPSPKMSSDLASEEHDLPRMEQRVQELKVALSSLHGIRESLLEVKLKVHRLTAEGGSPCFREHVQDLYRQWDDAYEMSGAKLTELQAMKNQWGAESQDALSERVAALEDSTVVTSEKKVTSENSRSPTSKPSSKDDPPSGRRLWRILKAALPVQVALVLLYCVACLMEPHCCDLLNNFHASFGPQLSYTHGPPPV
ncbi:uncharacterized protein LOC135396874 isoform X2 [Ornithodoros turicata]|uniref:uncharacterized protein LOC135396874 isoform X2 n=1 Tax=Ornithodoros turicata TaxID=34597 RepID=UPI003138AFE8